MEEEVQVNTDSWLITLLSTPLKDQDHHDDFLTDDLQVEERLVGAVLGPSGKHVTEIKQYRC